MLVFCTSGKGQNKFDWYSETASQGVRIQNSLPVGMGSLDSSGRTGYTDSSGKFFGYLIFFSRVINETATSLELTLNFPADFASPYSYLKLLLPPDTMTLDKESLFNYGVTDLKSFLDNSFNKPTMLQRTINPKEECLFHIVALWSKFEGRPSKFGGVARAELALKENDLFYRITGITPELDSALIPCGNIIYKK